MKEEDANYPYLQLPADFDESDRGRATPKTWSQEVSGRRAITPRDDSLSGLTLASRLISWSQGPPALRASSRHKREDGYSRSTASSPRVVDLAIVPVVPGSGPEHMCDRKWPVDTTERGKTATWSEGAC